MGGVLPLRVRQLRVSCIGTSLCISILPGTKRITCNHTLGEYHVSPLPTDYLNTSPWWSTVSFINKVSVGSRCSPRYGLHWKFPVRRECKYDCFNLLTSWNLWLYRSSWQEFSRTPTYIYALICISYLRHINSSTDIGPIIILQLPGQPCTRPAYLVMLQHDMIPIFSLHTIKSFQARGVCGGTPGVLQWLALPWKHC